MNITMTNLKSLAALALLLAAAGVLFAACGSLEIEVTSSETSDSTEPDTTASSGSTTDADESIAAVTEPEIEIGSDVGQMVPAFYFNDGASTKVTSEELFARGRPSFFYFFTTW